MTLAGNPSALESSVAIPINGRKAGKCTDLCSVCVCVRVCVCANRVGPADKVQKALRLLYKFLFDENTRGS